jgi:hypothetical protein
MHIDKNHASKQKYDQSVCCSWHGWHVPSRPRIRGYNAKACLWLARAHGWVVYSSLPGQQYHGWMVTVDDGCQHVLRCCTGVMQDEAQHLRPSHEVGK